jgi:hypothetical protein
MALITAVTDGAGMICSAAPAASPLNGMATMCVLMSVSHLPPCRYELRHRMSNQIDWRVVAIELWGGRRSRRNKYMHQTPFR